MGNETLQNFGYTFQIKIISSLLLDNAFLQQIADILEPDYFESNANKWVLECIFKYYDKHKISPTFEVFRAEVLDIDNDIIKATVLEALKDVHRHLESTDLDFIKEKTLEFCKNKCIKNAILDSVTLLESGNYDDIRNTIDNALKVGIEKDIGHEYNIQIEERYQESVRNTVETPWPVITGLMDGGLGKGELGVFVAPAGIGKSWALINIGANAIKKGLNVIHYTLELNQSYVGLRYDSVLTGIPAQNLKHHKEDVKELVKSIPGKLIIKYYPTKAARIQTLRAHIEKTTTLDIKPDLIIVDYADLLKGPGQEKRHELEGLYEDLRGIAGEYEIPIWTASQANRSSLEDDVEYIDASKIAESYSKVMIADFVMSLSRKVEDKVAGTGVWHVIKNRFGPDGITFPSQINTSSGQINIYEKNTVQGREASKKIENRSEYARQMLAQKFNELKE
jgi:replicative DNA helicase